MHSTRKRCLFYDLIRGVCALIVFLGHLRNAVLPPFNNLNSPGYLTKIYYFISGFGHECVLIFFVLSGYLVGGHIIRCGESFSWGPYIIKRLCRLWCVLIPALIATYIIDACIGFNDIKIYNNTFINSFPAEDNYSRSVTTFICNAFFLQNIISVNFGSNGPLWSLSYEFWYYILFPLIFLCINETKRYKKMLYILLLCLIIWFVVPIEMLALFPIWLFGVAAYFTRSFYDVSKYWSLGLVTFFSVLILIRFKLISGLFSSYLLGLSILALMVTCVKPCDFLINYFKIDKVVTFLSNFSYTLYLFHMPLILCVVHFCDGNTFSINALGVFVYSISSLFILLICVALYYCFEYNTLRIQNFFRRNHTKYSGFN